MSDIVVSQHNDAPLQAMTVAGLKAHIDLIRQAMSELMVRGSEGDGDYGIIPGCPKPSLFQSGAEKLKLLFRLSVGEPRIEDIGMPGEVGYRVTQAIMSSDGTVIGYGLGTCSTKEEKYRWKKANKAEYDAAPEDRRRIKQYANYSQPQVRVDPEEIANTVLQMAHKRCFVKGIRQCTAASMIFTQDMEDAPEGDGDQQQKPKPKAPQKRESGPVPFVPFADIAKMGDKDSGSTTGRLLSVQSTKAGGWFGKLQDPAAPASNGLDFSSFDPLPEWAKPGTVAHVIEFLVVHKNGKVYRNVKQWEAENVAPSDADHGDSQGS